MRKHREEIENILEEERRPAHQITKPAQYFNPHPDLATEVNELFETWSALWAEDELHYVQDIKAEFDNWDEVAQLGDITLSAFGKRRRASKLELRVRAVSVQVPSDIWETRRSSSWQIYTRIGRSQGRRTLRRLSFRC